MLTQDKPGKIKPLFMWAGGKNKMIKKYLQNPGLPRNFEVYVEPFFGAGAMFLWVAQNISGIKRFIINDKNQYIMGIFHSIKFDVDNFISELSVLQAEYIPLDKAERKVFYYALRSKYIKNACNEKETKEAAVLYFLMKTGFNGVWQSTKESGDKFATPSGLLNQKTQVFDEYNIRLWHELLQKTEINSGDWKNVCQPVKYEKSKAFFFFDPPYRDCFTVYSQIFGDKQQKELVETSIKLSENHDVFVCNRDSGDRFFENIKNNLNIEYYDVTYTAGRRKRNEDGSHSAKKAKEVLLHNLK